MQGFVDEFMLFLSQIANLSLSRQSHYRTYYIRILIDGGNPLVVRSLPVDLLYGYSRAEGSTSMCSLGPYFLLYLITLMLASTSIFLRLSDASRQPAVDIQLATPEETPRKLWPHQSAVKRAASARIAGPSWRRRRSGIPVCHYSRLEDDGAHTSHHPCNYSPVY